MAGEMQTDAVIAYLSRLTGETVSQDQPLRMRSVHRAAFSSWARQNKVPLRLEVMAGDAPFVLRDLLGTVAPDIIPASAATASIPPSSAFAGGIGIDIEDVEALPQTDDYREHPFYQDNFTSAEIAYCLRRADTRASFCGIWAAKEALLKSGLVAAESGQLKAIAIGRDAVGRPIFPGCALSISHTSRTAVAVCVVAAAKSSEPTMVEENPVTITWQASRPDPKRSKAIVAACALVVVVGCVLTFALRAWH
jgi:phosphopantetheine--protein transferase-like protein